MNTGAFLYRVLGLLLLNMCFCGLFAQGLETLAPVQLDAGPKVASGELMLSVTDFHKFFKSVSSSYSDCIEIIDAAQPWPPVWFSAVQPFKVGRLSQTPELNIITNFSYQAGAFSFYKESALLKTDSVHIVQHKIDFTNKKVLSAGYIICSSKFNPVDTLKSIGLPLNLHCMTINGKKEKLTMLQLDTLLDIKTADNSSKKLVKALVDIIAIYDSANKLIFKWNPVKALGTDAVNPNYIHTPSTTVSNEKADWSHGNSLSWDLDGNILYCFRHIGVGKISRADGHVMWHLDNKSIYTDNKNDTLTFYLQHDLVPVKNEGDYTRYSLYSNGDYLHTKSFGLEFKANNKDGSIKFIRKRYSSCAVPSTGAGNYEVDSNGNYILSYGITPDSTNNGAHTFCEMANSDGHIFARYSLPKDVFAFKVIRLKTPVTRPAINRRGNTLSAQGKMKGWVWYQLSGPGNNNVVKVGAGADFKPTTNGTYCVSGKLGIGYTVSAPFVFKL